MKTSAVIQYTKPQSHVFFSVIHLRPCAVSPAITRYVSVFGIYLPCRRFAVFCR